MDGYDGYNMRGIPGALVPQIWKFAEPFIKRALDHTFGELSAEDIQKFCETEQMQLWMMSKEGKVVGAGTTQIVIYPQMKVCRIVSMAGSEFDRWKNYAYMMMEVWAQELGCVAMEAYVRKGFVPKLEEIGFKHRYSVVHKKLGS